MKLSTKYKFSIFLTKYEYEYEMNNLFKIVYIEDALNIIYYKKKYVYVK